MYYCRMAGGLDVSHAKDINSRAVLDFLYKNLLPPGLCCVALQFTSIYVFVLFSDVCHFMIWVEFCHQKAALMGHIDNSKFNWKEGPTIKSTTKIDTF